MIAKQWAKIEQTHPVCIHSGKECKGREHQHIELLWNSKSKMNRKKENKTCSVSFVKVFKFQENKFKIVQKNFLEKII